MFEKYKATLKSSETEDKLDYYVIRPFSYLWACIFAKFDIHPNTVTIWSMFIGAGSAYFFFQPSYLYGGVNGLIMNIIAIILLMFADVLDCTDGQLARMTGKKSPLGRILDGMAGYTWFIPIYWALIFRFYFHHSIEFDFLGIPDTNENVIIATVIVMILGHISGFLGMGAQQCLADYYIQAHLFFLKGDEGSELDTSIRQKEILNTTDWTGRTFEKLFQQSYVNYTITQEKRTPEFQKLLSVLNKKYGKAGNVPVEIREELHRNSLSLMKWNGLLTFNFREFWLFLFCLLDIPVVHFLFEIIAMSLLTWYINHRHESFCKKVRLMVEKA